MSRDAPRLRQPFDDRVPVEPDKLTRALDALGPMARPESAIGEVLPHVMGAICGVFGVTGAGLMLVDEQSGLRYVAATDEAAEVLEQVQEQAGAGPCVESFVNDTEIVVNDLAADDRWPAITAPLLAAGVRSVLGVPTRLGGGPVGSLNVYGDARARVGRERARGDPVVQRRDRGADHLRRSRCATTAAWSSSCSTRSRTGSRSSARSAC